MIERITDFSPPAASADAVGISAKNEGGWAGCWNRARSFIKTPWIFLPWIFGLIFCAATYAVTKEDQTGSVLAAIALVGVVLLAVGGDNVKFWLVLYPLIFLNPVVSLGNWTDGGDKLFGLQIYEPWMLVLLCLWIPRLLAAKRLELPRNVKIALGGLVGFGLLGIWIAPDRLFAIKTGVRTLFEPLLLFALIASLRWKRAEIRQVVFVFLSVAAFVASLSLFGYVTEGGSPGQGGLMRLYFWEGPNVFATFLGAVILIALGWGLSHSSRMAVVTGMAAFVPAFAALALTYARGTWFALAIGLAFMTAQLRLWLWGFLAALLLLLGIVIGPFDILQRAESIIHFADDRSAVNRLLLWPKVLDLIADRPLTGYGFGGFQVLFSEQTEIHSYHAHNVLLDLAVTLGVPALLLILWLLGHTVLRSLATFRQCRRAEDAPLLVGLSAASMFIFLAGMTDGSIIVVWTVLSHAFWFLLALTYVSSDTVKELGSRQVEGPADILP